MSLYIDLALLDRITYPFHAEKRRPSSRASKIYSKTTIHGTRRLSFRGESEYGVLATHLTILSAEAAFKSSTFSFS
jgi:hypothetical protein